MLAKFKSCKIAMNYKVYFEKVYFIGNGLQKALKGLIKA